MKKTLTELLCNETLDQTQKLAVIQQLRNMNPNDETFKNPALIILADSYGLFNVSKWLIGYHPVVNQPTLPRTQWLFDARRLAFEHFYSKHFGDTSSLPDAAYQTLATIIVNETLSDSTKIAYIKGFHQQGMNLCLYPGEMSYLHLAAIHCSPTVIDCLIEVGAHVDARDKRSQATPLYFACYHGKESTALRLLEHNANYSACDARFRTTAMLAATGRCFKVLEQIVQRQNQLIGNQLIINAMSQSLIPYFTHKAQNFTVSELHELIQRVRGIDKPLLKHAASHPDSELLSALIECISAKANITLSADLKYSLLEIACRANSLENVRLLIALGANTNYQNKGHVVFSVRVTSLEVIKFLIRNETDPISMVSAGVHLIHRAVEMNNIDVIDLCLDHGIDINLCWQGCPPPIEFALRMKNYSRTTLEHLIKRGANLKDGMLDYYSALYLAVCYCNKEAALILKNQGLSFEASSQSLPCLLAYCIRYKEDNEMFKFLLQHGANVNFIDPKTKMNLLHMAAEHNRVNVIELLVGHYHFDVSSGTKDQHRHTALWFAQQAGASQAVQTLIRLGCRSYDTKQRTEQPPLMLGFSTINSDEPVHTPDAADMQRLYHQSVSDHDRLSERLSGSVHNFAQMHQSRQQRYQQEQAQQLRMLQARIDQLEQQVLKQPRTEPANQDEDDSDHPTQSKKPKL